MLILLLLLLLLNRQQGQSEHTHINLITMTTLETQKQWAFLPGGRCSEVIYLHSKNIKRYLKIMVFRDWWLLLRGSR